MEQTKQDKIFPDGLIFKKPKEGVPEFVKGHISIKVAEFKAFLEKYGAGKEWVNIDLKKSREGRLYTELNQWEKPRNSDGTDLPPF